MPAADQGTIPNITFSLLHFFHHYVEVSPSIHPSDRFNVPLQAPFLPTFPHQMGAGGPHTSVTNPNIQPLGQQMGQEFGRWLNSTISQAQSKAQSQAQSMAAGTSGGNPDPQAAYRNVDDSMNKGMANLSLSDHHPQISTDLAPPTLLSDRQVSLRPNQVGSSNLSPGNLGPYNGSVQQGSHLASSLAQRMNEPEMISAFSPQTDPRPSRRNNQNSPPPASTFQPSLNVGQNSNFTKNDRSVHRLNIDSHNEHNNTLRDSYNNNSLFDSTGRHSSMFYSVIYPSCLDVNDFFFRFS